MSTAISSSLISKLKSIQQEPVETQEHCHFCGKPIPEDHRHFLDLNSKRFVCVCEICVVTQSVHSHFKIIPGRYAWLKTFQMTDELWSEFMIPVNIAFFVFNPAQQGIVAYYPAPVGAMESKLTMEAWKQVEQLNPEIKSLSHELEALLVNRLDEKTEYFIVPIDCCYRLIGVIRSNWKGIFGGKDVQDAVRAFFEKLKIKIQNA